MGKTLNKNISTCFNHYRVEDPQMGIILKSVRSEKISEFLELITTTKRDVFHALYPSGEGEEKATKKQIEEAFNTAFTKNELQGEYGLEIEKDEKQDRKGQETKKKMTRNKKEEDEQQEKEDEQQEKEDED